MTEPQLIPISMDETFYFACHNKVPCFNHCCKDLNQALTPYDVLRLKNHLRMTAQEFITHYAVIYTGPATGLPVASLRFTTDKEKNCPFVTADGCSVYEARPSSCRIYPLARALQRSRTDGSVSEHFAVLKESHCRGFEQTGSQTVKQWITSQELAPYHEMNDAMMEFIAMKNQLRPGDLSPEHQRMVSMAFYDQDSIKKMARDGQLPRMDADGLTPMPSEADDIEWLRWSMTWITQVLYGSNR